jgi:hypothetical protein
LAAAIVTPFLICVFIRGVFPVMSRSNRKNDCSATGGARPAIVPAGTPDWITPELIERTIAVWQPFYRTVLTPEEAVTMILRVGRLFDVLSPRSSP